MKQFHISDVLSVTTDRLVSLDRMQGVRDIIQFMTNVDWMTHELPYASDLCKAALRMQYPQLFPDNPDMAALIVRLDKMANSGVPISLQARRQWLSQVCATLGVLVWLPVRPIGPV